MSRFPLPSPHRKRMSRVRRLPGPTRRGAQVPERDGDTGRLAVLPAVEMLRGFAARELSPVEVHDAVQAVVEAREPVLNAFWERDAATSYAAARASEERWAAGEPLGPLDGVPVTLKENLARRGVPMPAGNAGVDPVV